MEKLMDEMIELGLGNVMDVMIDENLSTDEMYLKDIKDANEIKERLKTLITKEKISLLEDWEASMETATSRACHIAYLTGVKNVLLFIKG